MPRIGFGAPQLLPLIVLALAAAGLYAWAARRRAAAEARYRGASALPLLAASVSPARRRVKAVLVTAALLLLALAAAQPQIGTRRTSLQRSGSDVIVALDVSLSMSATDVQPSRLERAKAAISAILDRLQGDRVGLVTFAGSASLRFPLTTDTEAARQVVQGLTLKDGGLQAGTDIGSALKQAALGFSNDKTRGKVLLLVSDGEDLGADATQAASFARAQGIALDTLGVGATTPAQLFFTDPRTGKQTLRIDPATNGPLTTTADPGALRALAAANGGRFYDGNSDVFAAQFADEVARLQKTRFADQQGIVPVERYQWFAGAGLLLLLLEFLLPAGRGGGAGGGLVRRLRIRHDESGAGGD